MQIYFNPIRIEYVRDLMLQTMGRSNKAAHSFYGIKSAVAAIGYQDTDEDIAAIEQELSQLSLFYRRQYDFVDDSAHIYANADNKNIDFLNEVLEDFSHLHSESDGLKAGVFNTSDLDTLSPLEFEEHLQFVPIPLDLRGFSFISGLGFIIMEETHPRRPVDEFVSMLAVYFSEDSVDINSGMMEAMNSVTPLPVPPVDISDELTIETAEVELEGFYITGILPIETIHSFKEYETVIGAGAVERIADALKEIGINPMQMVSLPGGFIGDQITLPERQTGNQLTMNGSVPDGNAGDTDSNTQSDIIKGFFANIARIDHLHDEDGTHIPPVTHLQELSPDMPVYEHDLKAGIDVRSDDGFKQLENVLFGENSITINQASTGTPQEYNRAAPKFFGSYFQDNTATLKDVERLKNNPSASVTLAERQTGDQLSMNGSVPGGNAGGADSNTQSDIIKGFFANIARIDHLHDEDGTHIPTVTHLQELSPDMPVYEHGLKAGIDIRSDDGFKQLENVSFGENSITINQAPTGTPQEYNRVMPKFFGSYFQENTATLKDVERLKNNPSASVTLTERQTGEQLTMNGSAPGGNVGGAQSNTQDDIIKGFFANIARIDHLHDEDGTNIPTVTHLQELSIDMPVYEHDLKAGIDVRLTDDFKQLEKVLFSENSVTINQVPIGTPQEYDHMLPPKFMSGQFQSIYTSLQDLDGCRDYNSIPIGTALPLDNILYVLDTQKEANELLDGAATGEYQAISKVLHDNLDAGLAMPVLNAGRYADVVDVDAKPVRPVIFPGVRITEEMSVNPFAASINDAPVIHNAEQLTEQTLDILTIVDDDGQLTNIPKVNVNGYSHASGWDTWRLGNKSGTYNSINQLSLEQDKASEILSATKGLFAAMQAVTRSYDGGSSGNQRTVTPYMDTEQLEIISYHIFIDDVVTTDYSRILAVNKLEDIMAAIRGGNVNNYAAKYENGVDGLAADITKAIKEAEIDMEGTDIFVKGLSDAVAVHIKDEYINSEKIPLGVPDLQNTEEALILNNEYDLNREVLIHGYVPQILSKDTDAFEDVALQIFDSSLKLNVFKASAKADNDINGIKLNHYSKNDADMVTLQTYVPDDIPSSTVRNEDEALSTNISQKDEDEVQISVTKRLELWLKWLFEMSMKPLGGNNTESFVNTAGHLKQMFVDEPVLSDVTRKSIKSFTENLDLLLFSFVAEAQSAASIDKR